MTHGSLKLDSVQAAESHARPGTLTFDFSGKWAPTSDATYARQSKTKKIVAAISRWLDEQL